MFTFDRRTAPFPALSLAITLGAIGCANETSPEPRGSTSSNIEASPGICGLANEQILTTKPDKYLCTEGTPSEVTGVWEWTCGTQAHCVAYPSSISYFNPDRDRRGELLRTVFAAIYGQPISDVQYDYWVNDYNPAAGVGCHAMMEGLLVYSPGRAQAVAATSASDPALTSYIEMLYRALLPNFGADNTTTIAGWRVAGYLTIEQLDGIFLDDPMMKNRCIAAGMEL
jgi:hypothetical protein